MLDNVTFARIPIVTGCNEDEGTELYPASLSDNMTVQPLSCSLDMMYPAPIPDGFLKAFGNNYPGDAGLGTEQMCITVPLRQPDYSTRVMTCLEAWFLRRS